jgi:hypothetical protein
MLISHGGGVFVWSGIPRAAKRSGDNDPAFFSFMSNCSKMERGRSHKGESNHERNVLNAVTIVQSIFVLYSAYYECEIY